MARTLEFLSKSEKARRRADRNAFNQLPREAKSEFDEKLREGMEGFNETLWKIRCEVADTYGHEVEALIAFRSSQVVNTSREFRATRESMK
jgi:hypothetical protein